MKFGYKLSTFITLAAISSISLMPKPATAVPAMNWMVRNFNNEPSQCAESAAHLLKALGLSPTQEGNLVKGFTDKTGVIVICNAAKGNGCYGSGSVASIFISSNTREGGEISRFIDSSFKVPLAVCND